jgi:acetyltransferase-like isoleucine patch superfamily enzyme
MKNFIYQVLCLIQFDRMVDFILKTRTQVRLFRYKEAGVAINFVPQGGHEIMIAGDISKFKIHSTSHLKSETFIECSGGVAIGRHFHTGRGLTIFSTNHNYMQPTHIPYDDIDIQRPVVIQDFVWCGANVTVLPGATIGEGAVIGAGSVVSGIIPSCAVAAGNPARVLRYRDTVHFQAVKERGLFA